MSIATDSFRLRTFKAGNGDFQFLWSIVEAGVRACCVVFSNVFLIAFAGDQEKKDFHLD